MVASNEIELRKTHLKDVEKIKNTLKSIDLIVDSELPMIGNDPVLPTIITRLTFPVDQPSVVGFVILSTGVHSSLRIEGTSLLTRNIGRHMDANQGETILGPGRGGTRVVLTPRNQRQAMFEGATNPEVLHALEIRGTFGLAETEEVIRHLDEQRNGAASYPSGGRRDDVLVVIRAFQALADGVPVEWVLRHF